MCISTPQFRSAISQLCAIFPYYLLNFVEGTSQGFEIVLLAELYKKDSEIPISIDQLTWLPSLSFLAPVGSLAVGFSTQRLGSRSMALVTSVLYIAAWLLLHYSTSAIVTFAGRVLGVVMATNALVTPYITEISEPQLRSKFLAICQMTKGFGSFFSLLLNSFVYWRTVALVNLAFPILAAVTVLATPNSPAWLTTKGRLDEAEEALCWLRGWVEPKQVQKELCALTDEKSSPTSNDRDDDVEGVGCRARSGHFCQLFLRRSFYLPLATACTIYLLHELTGAAAIQVYSAVVFPKIDSPIDASIASVVMSVTSIVGNLIIILFVRRTGKRKLVFGSVLVVALCYASTGIIGFFELQNEYRWIPSIAIVVAHLADSSGVGGVVHMVVSEIFPSSVRYIGTSIGASIYSIIMSVVNKSFLYVIDAITLPGAFLVFASMSVVALITYYFVFPETEGRSLCEIEDHFKAVKSTNEREK